MAFHQTEVIYYAFVFLFGCVGGLGRHLVDQNHPNRGSLISSVLSSGLWSFGAVGLWIGHSPDSIVGPMYFLAVAVFVGYFTPELFSYCKNIFRKIMNGILKKFGIEVED